MTDHEIEERIRKEEDNSVKKTILTIIGIVAGLAILVNTVDGGTGEQWGGVICIGAIVTALATVYNKIKE